MLQEGGEGKIYLVSIGEFGHFVDLFKAHYEFDFQFFATGQFDVGEDLEVAHHAVLVDARVSRAAVRLPFSSCSSSSSSAAGGTRPLPAEPCSPQIFRPA